MKKLMKTIAFATVMCMLLSTVAFAATDGTSESLVGNKILNITIAGVGDGEQVSLLVVAPGATTLDSSKIYYIDQALAASGQVTFSNINLTNVDGDTVEVWSGNATYAANTPDAPVQKLTDVRLTEGVTEVAIVKQESGVVVGADGIGLFADVAFTEVPDGYTLSKMVWAINVDGSEFEDGYIYTEAIDLAVAGYEVIASESGVKFAATIANNDSAYEFKGADAIFLFVKTGADDKVAYSDNEAIHSGNKSSAN